MTLTKTKTKMRVAEVLPQPGHFNCWDRAPLDTSKELLCHRREQDGLALPDLTFPARNVITVIVRERNP